jgi:hypothetical protein
MSYKEDIILNKYKLDDACEKQSSLHLQYSSELADKKNELNNLKNTRKIIRAKVDQFIRSEFAKSGAKTTDAATASMIEIHKDVIEIETQISNIQYEVDIMDGVVESFKQRKSMINDLVQLHLSGFFSDPSGKIMVNKARTEQLNNLNKGV